MNASKKQSNGMRASAASVNPFRSECVERLHYRLDAGGWHALLDRLAALDHRAALVGPCGSGKTTLLEELRERFETRGVPTAHLRLGVERPATLRADFERFLAAAPGRMPFLDGAEQLNWWQWRRLVQATRGAAGLVITAHRAGRLPTLRACGTTPELLQDVVGELLGTGEFAPWMNAENIAERWGRHAGNVRNALRELYDEWARPATVALARVPAPGE